MLKLETVEDERESFEDTADAALDETVDTDAIDKIPETGEA